MRKVELWMAAPLGAALLVAGGTSAAPHKPHPTPRASAAAKPAAAEAAAPAAEKPAPPPETQYVLPSSGVLTKDDLTKYGFKVLSFKPKDEFDSPPDTHELAGRAFSVELKANFTYDTQQQVLQFAAYTSDWSGYSLLGAKVDEWRGIMGFELARHETSLGSYKGSNAYGASVTVDKTHTDSVALAHFSREFALLDPAAAGLPPPHNAEKYDTTYKAKIPVSPDAGRELAKSAVLVITGVVAALPDGRSVVCGGHYHEPKIDAAFEDSGTNCVIAADIQRIAFVNKATGEIIAHWDK